MKELVTWVNILVLTGAAWWYWRREKQFRKLFWAALILKVIAGICVGVIYKYYYTVGDTLEYFYQGTLLSDLARSDLRKYFVFLWSSEDVLPVVANQPDRALFF